MHLLKNYQLFIGQWFAIDIQFDIFKALFMLDDFLSYVEKLEVIIKIDT